MSESEKLNLSAQLHELECKIVDEDQSNLRINLEQNFEAFVRQFWDEVPGAGTMSWNWHMSILCSELQILAERVFNGLTRLHDLIFNVSPGTSKSTIGSILFPAWTWTRMPQARHICASHTETLVLDLAAKARYVIQSEKFQSFWPVALRADQSTKSYYANTSGGDRLSCTVGGKSPTGFHAHFLTCLPGHVEIFTNQDIRTLAEIVETRANISILGFNHQTNKLEYQQIKSWQRSPGRRLLRIKLCKCEHSNPSTQAPGDIGASMEIQSCVDSQVREWVPAESGHENICIYREVIVPLPGDFKNLENEGQEVVPQPSVSKISGIQPTQEVEYLSTTHKTSEIKPPDLEQVDWEELYSDGMTEVEWIITGRPHWQCYSCRQLFTTMPIPPEFICPLCCDKTPTPLISKNTVGEVDTVRNFLENIPFGPSPLTHLGELLNTKELTDRALQGHRSHQKVEESPPRLFLECTEDHPVFADNLFSAAKPTYVPANLLLVGATLLGADGYKYRIESIDFVPEIPKFVYNLQTEPNHNFFANGILVHNCDDPIDPKRAVSEAELKTAADFVTNILPSRKVDKAVSVTTLIMQRLHDVDPTGVLLAKAKQYAEVGRIRHVCLPARLADNTLPVELREKYTDGLMDPDRLPEIILREQEILLGVYSFSGQYMQCLVGETSIRTNRGDIPIARVDVGDLVATRNGWQRVLWAGATGATTKLSSVLFANGSVLIGTGNHPVWCEDVGWVPLDALHGGMYNTAFAQGGSSWADQRKPRHRLSSSTGRIITGVQGNDTSSLGTGRDSMSLCGFTIRETSPLATTSITKTATQLIIELKILNASLLGSIVDATPTIPKSVVAFLLKSASSVCPGIRVKKARSIIRSKVVSLLRTCGRTPPTAITFAVPVAKPFSQEDLVRNLPSIAHRHATNANGYVPTTRSASGARPPSQRRTTASVPVLDPVPPTGGVQGVKVFDVTVEDSHEFFANGVLVHNSPVPLSGGMFKVDYFNQRVKAAPFDAQRVLYIDRASTQDGGCYTAMVLLARAQDGSAFFVEHCVHGQWEPDERNRRTRAEALRCRARYGTHEPLIYIEAEGGSSGRDSYKGVARTLAGFSVREHRPTGRKEVRAEPWACQLAAGNVFIVEDGSRSWDIENYIQEHVHFPLGKYKDQVDSSSGGFSLLIQQRPAGGLRSYRLQHHKKKGLQVILCSPEQLTGLELTRRCLLIYLQDPETVKGVMSDVSSVRDVPPTEGVSLLLREDKPLGKEVMPAHGLPAVLDSLTLDFLPNSPADFQESWDAVLPDYGTTVESLLLTREKAKRFWAFTTRHRDPWAEAVVLVDDNEQRLLAAGLACCDGLGLPRADTLAWTGRDSWQANRDTKAEAVFIYEQLRSGRNLVV